MKHNQRVWNLFCLITALSVFAAVLSEARQNQFFLFTKPLTAEKHHVFTDMQRQPDLAFFWALTQRVSQPRSDLSDRQKDLIHEEFRRLFVQIIAAEQKSVSEDSGVPFSTSWRVKQILAEHRQAIHNIFTSKQHRKNRTRKHATKSLEKFYASLELSRSAPSVIRLAQIDAHHEKVPSGTILYSSKGLLVHMSPSDSSARDLHQLQILRL